MDSAALLPLVEMALSAATRAGADAADAMAADSEDLSVSIRHGVPESIEHAKARGIGLRVFIGQASATLSTSDVSASALAALAEQAVAIARVAPADPYAGLADSALIARDYTPPIYDQESPAIETLLALAREAEAAGRDVKGITNSEGADASSAHHGVALGTSHGFRGHYASSRYALSASMIAGTGDSMQRDYDYAYVTRHADLPSAASIGAQAAARAVARLNPRKVASQTAPIYFEPRVGRQLLSAFAGAISGSAIARGTSFLKDCLHQPVFAPGIAITDDPLLPGGLGSRPFDGEGIAAKACDLVQAGRLTTWLLDSRSARQLGMVTTGHAARGLAGAPHPSASNLYVHAGTQSPTALMQALGDGLYVTETIGHGVNLITGDYSLGASGFWVKDGVRGEPVSEITIAGNLRGMFATLQAANDLTFRYATNVPTLAIPSMTIAGN
jgi:PmbA protein